MAALILGDIPSNINTYERLLVWAAQCVQSVSNGGQVNVATGQQHQPECYVSVFVAADNTDRYAIQAYLPLDYAALNDPNEKTWMAASDVGAAAPHANLLAN